MFTSLQVVMQYVFVIVSQTCIAGIRFVLIAEKYAVTYWR